MRLKQGIVRLLKATGLHTLQANVRFLAKHDITYLPFERVNPLLDVFQKELNGSLPLIADSDETLERLLMTEASLCRFGDGEFLLLDGRDNLFQKSTPLLRQKLRAALASDLPSLLVGLPQGLFSPTPETPEHVRHYGRCFLAFHRNAIFPLLQRKRYDNASVTLPGFHFSPGSMAAYFKRFRSLWNGKPIVLIQGDSLLSEYEYNVFDTASEIAVVDAPRRNAFDRYDELMDRARSFPDNSLYCLCLGSTATVMAFDLAREGRRALDLGHLPKAYDHFMRGLPFDDWATGVRFFTED